VFQVEGIIKYHRTWVIAWIAGDFDKYYRALLPKALYIKPPRSKPHVSIVRVFEEPKHEEWGLHDGESIIIDVIPGIQTDGVYYWLDCFSDEVGYLRRRLGLSTFRDDDDSFVLYNCYHITIGNVK